MARRFEHFEEDFNLRLALFLQPFLSTNGVQDVALITPAVIRPARNASHYDNGTNVFHKIASMDVQQGLSNVLARVRIFAASPSAMDEVLVATNTESMFPRAVVAQQLTNVLPYRSFASFCATDAQLAREVLHELELRRVDLKGDQHLALISEWDTFYGRMLSLTYATEVARIQAGRAWLGSRRSSSLIFADRVGRRRPTIRKKGPHGRPICTLSFISAVWTAKLWMVSQGQRSQTFAKANP